MDLWCDEAWKHTHPVHRTAVPAGHAELELLGRRRLRHGGQRRRPAPGQISLQRHLPFQRRRQPKGPRPTPTRWARSWADKAAEEPAIGRIIVNCLPNGASHTITFNPSIIRIPSTGKSSRPFSGAICENGGTALQINMLDPDMLGTPRSTRRTTATCWSGSPATMPISRPSERSCRTR